MFLRQTKIHVNNILNNTNLTSQHLNKRLILKPGPEPQDRSKHAPAAAGRTKSLIKSSQVLPGPGDPVRLQLIRPNSTQGKRSLQRSDRTGPDQSLRK